MGIREVALTEFFKSRNKVSVGEPAEAATSAREALKYTEIVQLLCKFHSHVHNSWLVIAVKLIILLTLNV